VKKNFDRKFNLKKKYGITVEEFEQMLKNQDYKCDICKLPSDSFKEWLVVDHNHTTGKVRGLLCKSCNFGLGNFKDSTFNLQNALNYLLKQ